MPWWIQRVGDGNDLYKNIGSKISILCFDSEKNWEEKLAISVAENYFGAILSGSLVVSINDKYELNKDNIERFFDYPEIKKEVINLDNEPESFDACRNYVIALKDSDLFDNLYVEETQMQYLNRCQVRILVGDGLPKRVCVLRNGMFITDRLQGLKQFSDFKDFVAVVRCMNREGNELLRAMEPPKHDDFEPERLSTREDREKGKRALKKISTWVRSMLKRHAKDPVSEVTEIDELKDFFSEEGKDGSGEGTEDINPFGKPIIKGKPIKMRLHPTKIVADDFDNIENEGESDQADNGYSGQHNPNQDGDGIRGGEGGRGNSNPGEKSGNQGGKGGILKIATLRNIRSTITDKKRRILAFTPGITGKIRIQILEAGADSDYNTKIIATNIGKIENGTLTVDVVEGIRFLAEVKLEENFNGSIKVIAHEIR